MKLDSFKLKIIAMILMVLDHLPKLLIIRQYGLDGLVDW